jgi:hypothetical protein
MRSTSASRSLSRADGNPRDIGNLFVREPFEFAQHKHLAEAHREIFKSLPDQLLVGALEQKRLRS